MILINHFRSEESKIIDTINTGNTDFSNDVSELVFTEEVEDGIICIATSKGGSMIVSYLKNEKLSDTKYQLMGRFTADPDKIISADPLSVEIMPIANFSEHSYYFGFCSDESAMKLSVDGNTIEPEKVSIEINEKIYTGYFWFYKSTDQPTVQVIDK